MFALKRRTRIANRVSRMARILLIAVIVSNVLAPTTTVAQAKQEVTTTTGHVTRSVKQESRAIPIFERPEPRVEKRSSQADERSQTRVFPAKADPLLSSMYNLVQFDMPTQDANFVCEDIYPTNSCPDHIAHPGPFLATSTVNSTGWTGASAHIECPPENPYCYDDYDVYYYADYAYSWTTFEGHYGPGRLTLFISHLYDGSERWQFPCGGSGRSGSCSGAVSGIIPAASMSNGQVSGHMRLDIDSPSSGSGKLKVYFSLFPSVYFGSIFNAGHNKSPNNGYVESDSDISNLSCTQGICGDPINTRTGVFSFTQTDLSFPTSAGELVFQRSYSTGTVDEYTGLLGYGWTHNHDARLIFPGDPGGTPDFVRFKSVLGNQFLFHIESDGSFRPWPGVFATLVESNGTYTLTTSQQSTFQFSSSGYLISRQDAQGHAFGYDYDAQGRLIKVSADGGARFIQIGYDAQNRINSISDHASRQVSYVYDANGDLTSSTDVLGQTWTYVYDTGHRMTQAKDPAGVQTTVTEYDVEGRAYRQFDGEGNRIVLIVYNSDGTTTVSDALNNVEEHQYNAQNIVTQTTDPVGRTETTTYDGKFRPTAITNSAGQTLQMEWSADGVNLESKIDPAGNQTDYTYDALNNLTSVIDPRSFLTTYTYNGKLLTSSTDALNGVTTYTYTPEGYLESVTDPSGRVTSYEYDTFGQRISMTDPSGNIWHYTYDSLGRLIDTTDPRGRVTLNEYNAAGKLTKVTQNYDAGRAKNAENQYNIVTEYEYDLRGNQVAVIDTYNRTTRYVYDDADRLVQTIDPLGKITTNAYDAAGHLISTTDPLLHTTTYEYDAAGRLVKTINHLGFHSGITTFDVNANTSTVTDVLGRSTVFHYDELGRVIKVVDPLGRFTTTTYDPNGNVATRTDQLGRTTQYEYDALNRLIRTTDPNGGVTETFYDAAGNRIATEDPLDHRTTYTYDEAGRLIATTDPLLRITRTEYDVYGRRAATIDAAGHRTTYTYDALDRVIAVIDDDGNTTYTTYDALGNALTHTDANGHTTTTVYDALNRPQTVTDAEGNTTTNTYDDAGNLIAVTDALGKTTQYTYDELNRQSAVTDPLGNITRSYYDALGNLFDKVDANGVVTHYVYDELNRQVAVILNHQPGVDPDAETNVRYEFVYNEVGNRVSVKDPMGNIITYGYDALNRLISKTDPLGNIWSYAYDLAGNRTSVTDARNQTIYYTYDVAGQLTNIDYPGTEPDVTFSYDLTGQRIGMTDGLGTTTWACNDVNRLTSVTDAFGQTIGYGYDAAGNRTGLTYPDGKVVTYAFDDINQLVGVTDWENQTTGYSYDAAGRLASISRPNGVASQYGYDDAGRLEALQHKLGANTLASYNYTYDPAGNRTQAIENVQNPQLASSSSVPVANISGPGKPLAEHVHASQKGLPLFAPAPAKTVTPTATAGPPLTVTPPPTGTPFDPAQGTPVTSQDPVPPVDVPPSPPPLTDTSTDSSQMGTDELSSTSEAGTGYSVALLHMNGADASTTFTDELGKTWTANGDAQIDTAQSKFGGASGLFDGTGDSLTTPDHDDFHLANGDWTMEFWVRFNAIGTSVNLVSQHQDANNWMDIWVGESGSNLYFAHKAGGVMTARFSASTSFSPNTWYHIAIERNGNTPRIAVNGTFLSVTESTAIAGKTLSNLSGPLTVAAYNGSGSLNGWLDEFRFSKGIARWTSNFTPPTSEYVFTVLPGAATLVSPSGDIGRTYSPTYTWNKVDTATWYYLWVDGPSGNVIQQWYQSSVICTGGTCAATPTVTLGGGGHTWWVRTWNEEGYGPWSAAMTFSTTVPTPPVAATLVSPSGSASTQPTYTWNAVLDSAQGDAATWYYLWVNGPSGNVIQQWYEASAVCSGATCSVTPTVSLPIGSYTWWIRTWNATGYGPWSSGMSFSANVPTATPTFTATATATFTPTPYPSGPVTIDYTYDALHRLTSATYSDGISFGYTYDPAGNVLELQKNLGPGTIVTTYSYDAANQLQTAVENGVTWQYNYDANGSLVETLPDGNAANGAKRYTYNTAGYLMQVEMHNGSAWSVQAEMDYNGLGQRLSMDAAGVIAHYVIDGNQPLVATSENITFYLYGLGVIAEKTNAWAYSLPDGMHTPRQLTNPTGGVTLAGRYTPWGDILEVYGTGNFTFGYLSGIMDLATGLIYVGNGQYYDPATGRFLSRGVNSNSTNPYVPWNPIGAILGPLVIFSLIAVRKRSKYGKGSSPLLMLFILFVLPLSIGLACDEGGVTPTEPVNFTATVDNGMITATANVGGQVITGTAVAPSTPIPVPCPEPDTVQNVFRLTDTDWEGRGLVKFLQGMTEYNETSKQAVFLALDMIQRASGKTPEGVVDWIVGTGTNSSVNIISMGGDSFGGGNVGNGVLQLYAMHTPQYMSPDGLAILVHEMGHGVDESVGAEMGFGEPYSKHADVNGIGWNPDWLETSPDVFIFVGDENGPANNYLRYSNGQWAPNEDFASSFASVVIETNINMGLTNIGGTTTLSTFIQLQPAGSYPGWPSTAYVDETRRTAINRILGR